MADETPMQAEFDTVAAWTADAALALGPDHHIPAGCRGSGGPRSLDHLLDGMSATSGRRLLDVGAGVGGPGEYAATRRGLRPVLVEPEGGAAVAARRLFDRPTVRADAAALPFADGTFGLVWSLAVLCTTPDHYATLRELRRVCAPGGRIGLLVYVARHTLPEQPQGNNFPSPDGLDGTIGRVGLRVRSDRAMIPPDEEAPAWRRQLETVAAEVSAHHRDDEAWQAAQEQESIMGRRLAAGDVTGRLLVLEPATVT